MEFTDIQKCDIFDKINASYFQKNFGTMTKSDLETLLFSEYIEKCIINEQAYDDYTLSKELGITQSRIRTLKERKELKYPHEGFDWRQAFVQAVQNAKYDQKDHLVKMIIEDINVMQEIRHFIETKGWYDECSLNKKLLRIPLDCFIEIVLGEDNLNEVFSEDTKRQIKNIARENNGVSAFINEFSKEGLKKFLMTASKEVLAEVLKTLSFGGIADKAINHLLKIISDN